MSFFGKVTKSFTHSVEGLLVETAKQVIRANQDFLVIWDRALDFEGSAGPGSKQSGDKLIMLFPQGG